MQGLAGKVVVVTGAGSGIGRALAFALAGRGAVVAVADVDDTAAKATAESIVREGGAATPHWVDVSSEESVRALREAVVGAHRGVDILVNNAGIGTPPTRATDLAPGLLRRVMDVNFWGVVHGSLVFLPDLLGRPAANLVNVASNAALAGYSRQTSYCASKFAVRGFTEALRMELHGTPVRVTLVCPGATRTPIMSHSPLMDERQRAAAQAGLDGVWGRSPTAVAERIVGGIRRGRPRVLIGPDTVALDTLARLFPGAYSRVLHQPIERFLDRVFVTDGSEKR